VCPLTIKKLLLGGGKLVPGKVEGGGRLSFIGKGDRVIFTGGKERNGGRAPGAEVGPGSLGIGGGREGE